MRETEISVLEEQKNPHDLVIEENKHFKSGRHTKRVSSHPSRLTMKEKLKV